MGKVNSFGKRNVKSAWPKYRQKGDNGVRENNTPKNFGVKGDCKIAWILYK